MNSSLPFSSSTSSVKSILKRSEFSLHPPPKCAAGGKWDINRRGRVGAVGPAVLGWGLVNQGPLFPPGTEQHSGVVPRGFVRPPTHLPLSPWTSSRGLGRRPGRGCGRRQCPRGGGARHLCIPALRSARLARLTMKPSGVLCREDHRGKFSVYLGSPPGPGSPLPVWDPARCEPPTWPSLSPTRCPTVSEPSVRGIRDYPGGSCPDTWRLPELPTKAVEAAWGGAQGSSVSRT